MAGSNPNDQLEYLTPGNRNVDSTINEALKIFQDFQDDDLWETFREEFEGFTEEDFRRGTTNFQLRKLRALLRRRGVWVMKDERVTIAKSLYTTLQEDKPTPWTEDEVNNCYDKEGFCSFYLKYLKESEFGKKVKITEFRSPKLSPAASSTSPRFSSAAPAAPAPSNAAIAPQSTAQFAGQIPSQFATPAPQDFAPPGPQTMPAAPPVFPQLPTSVPPPDPFLAPLAIPPVPQPQPTYQPVPTPQGQASATTAISGYGRELSNLAKMYTEESKYSGENDSFTFKLAIFNDICSRADVPAEARMKAFPTMLKGLALDYYYSNISITGLTMNFDQVCYLIRAYFEGAEYKRSILSKWNSITLRSTMTENEGKTMEESLQLLIKELRHLQHGLDFELRTDKFIHNKLINACQDVPACQYACFKPSDSLAGLINDLRSSIITHQKAHPTEVFFTDRRYHKFDNSRRTQSQPRRSYGGGGSRGGGGRNKKCFVCQKEGCWSTKHTKDEQQASIKRYKERIGQQFEKSAAHYISNFEGVESGDNDNDEDENEDDLVNQMEALIVNTGPEAHDDFGSSEAFSTSFGPLSHAEVLTTNLANRSFSHSLHGSAPEPAPKPASDDDQIPFAYIVTNRYTSDKFFGIMIDTGASIHSTAGYGQFLAYQKYNPNTSIDTSTKGAINVQFGIGSITSMGSAIISTPIGSIEFHVVQADTPFLLCLADLDRLNVYYNNVTNSLVMKDRTISVIRRFGHPWLLWKSSLEAYITESLDENPCLLTDTELRQLHRRFGHPSAARLRLLLERSGHEINKPTLDKLTKYCSYCQKHGKSPGRFKFTLRDDVNFNFTIFVDIMYIDNSPILHVVDEATRYQAAKWLQNISSKHTWDVLRLCWIDCYLGPPDFIRHDAGKNFVSREFKQFASSMAITTRSVPVEAHWSIGIVERYHAVLRRAYQIIVDEGITQKEIALQMAVKSVNDTAGPNGLVPTLLVFGAYPRMHSMDPPAPTIIQRAAAIEKAMHEVRKIYAERQVADALNTRNGPQVDSVHNLSINSDVLVFREGNAGRTGKWTGPFKLLGIVNETCKISLPSGPTDFRSTVVKPYLIEPEDNDPNDTPRTKHDDQKNGHEEDHSPISGPIAVDSIPAVVVAPPPISANLPISSLDDHDREAVSPSLARENSDQSSRNPRVRRLPARFQNLADVTIFLQDDHLLPSESAPPPIPGSFTESRQKEINGLMEKGVFQVIPISQVPRNTRIFNSRFVDEVKNIGTAAAYEKSRLVVQAYNDHEKETILTQAPTIQRMSQRLILALAAIHPHLNLFLRDITQAYVQSTTALNREFFVRPPIELGLPNTTVLKVIKPLYGVPEAGAHWYKTYHAHHIQNLTMLESSYDSCLLWVSNPSMGFGVVGLQTDDTLILADKTFAAAEEVELQKAKLLAKPRDQLTIDHPIKFNGGFITLAADRSIYLNQESQCKCLRLITLKKPLDLVSSRGLIRKSVTPKDQYVAQRARGAYIATVSQPESAFDLSFAAQVVNPKEEDAKLLNKRLDWQIKHADRGIRFVQLDPTSLKLVVFTDASFANNLNFTSQIGYVICLADQFNKANIIHWSSTKCKRVTRSVLASELYAMAHGFDAGSVIKSTVEKIIASSTSASISASDNSSTSTSSLSASTLPLLPLPMIICTDSKSLYDCLVKLGSTQEKRLMVDVMCLRQSYERREIMEIKWIDGNSNPADAMTKAKPCRALQDLINTNTINFTTSGWVERDDAHGGGK